MAKDRRRIDTEGAGFRKAENSRGRKSGFFPGPTNTGPTRNRPRRNVPSSRVPERSGPKRRGRLRRWLLFLVSVTALFVIWQLAAAAVGAEIIVPTPWAAIRALGGFLGRGDFWAAVGATLSRGFAGFLLSTAAGLVVGTAAGLNSTFRTLFRPVLSVIRTTPVMSIIIIALIWFTTDTVPVFASFLIAFPVVCGNVIQGIDSIDADLVEMARVFRVPRRRVLFSLVVPSVVPYFLAGASTALGLTWKVVVAAEVLAQPIRAVGTGLYTAKVQLETPEVFAWTVVAILLSGMSEGAFHFLMRRISWVRHGEGRT